MVTSSICSEKEKLYTIGQVAKNVVFQERR